MSYIGHPKRCFVEWTRIVFQLTVFLFWFILQHPDPRQDLVFFNLRLVFHKTSVDPVELITNLSSVNDPLVIITEFPQTR